jgi:hypothetical protein
MLYASGVKAVLNEFRGELCDEKMERIEKGA